LNTRKFAVLYQNIAIRKRLGVNVYLCIMKNEISIPVQVHDLKEEDVIAAVEHRKKYSTKRDLQALEFNQAIVTRLAKEKEKQEAEQIEIKKMVKKEKSEIDISDGKSEIDLDS
jgi:hypothetical protein